MNENEAKQQAGTVPDGERIASLNLRFDFASYADTRRFLDQMADLSKREDYYPDVSFGKTYANISIDGDGQTALQQRNSGFINEMKALAVQQGSS
ncbi:MAG: hypothetical protein ACYCY1_13550 [Sulfuriferula sp.]